MNQKDPDVRREKFEALVIAALSESTVWHTDQFKMTTNTGNKGCRIRRG